MSRISNYIETKNGNGEKVLSVFLTSGFPNPDNFCDLSLNILNAGADMLEIGFPFSDPLADGPIIQESSKISLSNGIGLLKTFEYVKQIRMKTDKPILLMGYANPVLSFGLKNFVNQCKDSGIDGIIIPDVPIDEFDNFYTDEFNGIDIIQLITPTTSENRIKRIDEKSSGFVYCVSVSGTTGLHNKKRNLEFIEKNHSELKNNKMLVGFGISNSDDAKIYSEISDGVIIGSAIIKSLMNDNFEYKNTIQLVREIKNAINSTG